MIIVGVVVSLVVAFAVGVWVGLQMAVFGLAAIVKEKGGLTLEPGRARYGVPPQPPFRR